MARFEGEAKEARVETRQHEYKTDIARLSEEFARRETRLLLAMASTISLGVVTLGFLICSGG